MIYRQIEYTIWEKNFIKLFNKAGVRREAGITARNGELYISIPPGYEKMPDTYARQYIDNLYNTMEYHKKQEIKSILR